MRAAEAIEQLDAFLAEEGEDVVLLRETDDGSVAAQVTCRARVDRATVNQVAAGIKPSDFNLIISPTPLLAAGWPDGNPVNITPIENGPDKVALRGHPRRTVAWADDKRIDNQVVRINLRVTG